MQTSEVSVCTGTVLGSGSLVGFICDSNFIVSPFNEGSILKVTDRQLRQTEYGMKNEEKVGGL